MVEFGPMVSILVAQCNTAKRLNRLTAITWVQEFIQLGGDRLLFFYSDILGAIMHCISDSDSDIRTVSFVLLLLVPFIQTARPHLSHEISLLSGAGGRLHEPRVARAGS